MKKALTLALAAMLILSMTVVASAATFDPYIGGRITWSYAPDDPNRAEGDPVNLDNSGIKLLLKGKISDEATGTWGAIGAKIDGWPNDGELGGPNAIYDFGVNNIGGSDVSIWYTNWENENMKRGQGRVYDVGPVQYHEDPMFDHAMGNVVGVDYKTDNVIINFGYIIDENSLGDNDIQIAGTFKFDGGNVHFGYWNGIKNFEDTDFDANEINIGAEFKLGFGTIKADYVTLDLGSDVFGDPSWYDGGSIAQVAVFFDDLKFDVTLIADSEYKFKNDGGFGYQIRYTGLDKFTFAYKAMEAEEAWDDEDNFTDMYVGYKFGLFETRLGYATRGEYDDNDFVYASVYASFW